MSNSIKGCSCGSDCCNQEQEKKSIKIDFLYLDLSTCERCQGTESNLDKAINEVSTVLKSAGYEVILNKINITSPDLAIRYEFISSPTIRINDNDIALELTETSCENCGDLCGEDIECRSWVYEGIEYAEPPKELIVNAIMKTIYGKNENPTREKQKYELPENLKIFFEGLTK